MDIRIEVSGVKEMISKFQDSRFAVMKVAAMALNRAAKTGQVQISQISRQEYTMKASDAKDKIDIKKANMRWLQASVIVSGKPIPLKQFQTKGTGRPYGQRATAASRTKARKGGVRYNTMQVMVKRSGGYKPLPKAFTARGRYGDDIFTRTSKARGPLKALRGPSMAGIVKDSVRTQTIRDIIIKRFNDEFVRGMQYAIDKGRIQSGE